MLNYNLRIMKILNKVILWSFVAGVISCILAFLFPISGVYFYLFVVSAIVFVISLGILFFRGESIENSEANETYADFLNNNLNEEFDKGVQIECSGKWHAIPSKNREKLLFIKTDSDGFKEFIIDNFCVSNSIYDENGLVAVDDQRKKLLLYNFDDNNPSYKVVNYKDLLSVAIITDGKLISEKSTMRTIGGALVGGALFGNAGAVVGGLSGDSTMGEKIGKVLVKFILRDISTPSFEIVFLDMMPIKPSAVDYYKVENALKKANKIKDLTAIVIDEVDRQEKQIQTSQSPSSEKPSMADELAKLAKLKADGILTDEEFQTQKAKLLN